MFYIFREQNKEETLTSSYIFQSDISSKEETSKRVREVMNEHCLKIGQIIVIEGKKLNVREVSRSSSDREIWV